MRPFRWSQEIKFLSSQKSLPVLTMRAGAEAIRSSCKHRVRTNFTTLLHVRSAKCVGSSSQPDICCSSSIAGKTQGRPGLQRGRIRDHGTRLDHNLFARSGLHSVENRYHRVRQRRSDTITMPNVYRAIMVVACGTEFLARHANVVMFTAKAICVVAGISLATSRSLQAGAARCFSIS
jgi:hypothetical protein